MDELIEFKIEVKDTIDIVDDVSNIIVESQRVTYREVNVILLQRNWLIGKRIHDEELKETRKENYGKEIIKNLSKELKTRFGLGFSETNLYQFYIFYKIYKKIFHSVSGESLLSWTHYRYLIYVEDNDAREWYENNASKYRWGVRELERNIKTQTYNRLLSTQRNELIGEENNTALVSYDKDKYEHLKNPLILDFTNLQDRKRIKERELELAIITNITKMLMELGKGYTFYKNQYHLHVDSSDYYIDLVFYNHILNYFLLVDLKTNKVTHKDVGQMDMYVQMFDETVKKKEDNPTLGMILCSETSSIVATYSLVNGSEQLFVTKYKLYLPSDEELRREIEKEKRIYELSLHKKKNKKKS